MAVRGACPEASGTVRMSARVSSAGSARVRSRTRASVMRYFLRRAPERFAALKEIPARIAFCWTAAAVRPSFLAT